MEAIKAFDDKKSQQTRNRGNIPMLMKVFYKEIYSSHYT